MEYHACVLFLIQREDAYIFKHNDGMDGRFGNTPIRRRTSSRIRYSAKFINDKIMLIAESKLT